MENRRIFSERLKYERTSVGLSQSALANKFAISDAAITMLEKCKRSPSFELLIALADYFDVSLDYLVGRSDDPARR